MIGGDACRIVIRVGVHLSLLAPGCGISALGLAFLNEFQFAFADSCDDLDEFEAPLTGEVLDYLDGGPVMRVPDVLQEHLNFGTFREFLFAITDSV